MTNPPQDPHTFNPAPSTTLDLVRSEIGQMRVLADQYRSEVESERLEHERATSALITRTEEHAAHIRAEAEAYATATRQSADDYAAEQRTEIDQVLSDAEARLTNLVDAQLEARANLAKVVNSIDIALDNTALDNIAVDHIAVDQNSVAPPRDIA